MRKILLTTLVVLVAIAANAQKRTELKGPAAKNYKVWEDNTPATPMYASSNEALKGPQAKNTAEWQREKDNDILIVTRKREKLMGPAAKNYKPWEHKSSKTKSTGEDTPLVAKTN